VSTGNQASTNSGAMYAKRPWAMFWPRRYQRCIQVEAFPPFAHQDHRQESFPLPVAGFGNFGYMGGSVHALGRHVRPGWEDISCDCRQALPCPQPSLFCLPRCCSARAVRQCRKPRQVPPPRFLALRSKRRSRWQGRTGRSERQPQLPLTGQSHLTGHPHLAGHRPPLKRHRLSLKCDRVLQVQH